MKKTSGAVGWCVALMVSVVAVALAAEAWLFTSASSFQRILHGSDIDDYFDFGRLKYPVLYTGEQVRVPEEVHHLTRFSPLFGADRERVNPTMPEVVSLGRGSLGWRGSALIFSQPGEYYLTVNQTHPIKVLVLARDEAISEGVLRLFDFTVANLLFCNGDDPRYKQQGAHIFIHEWFTSAQAGALLCGPTGGLFRELVHDRFRLPTRIANLLGVFEQDGQLAWTTHNVPEVYLPDQQGFVLFDINKAFVARWKGAIQVALTFREATLNASGPMPQELWERLPLDLYHSPVTPYLPVTNYPNTAQSLTFSIGQELLSKVQTTAGRDGLPRVFSAAISYLPDKGYGTGFLDRWTMGTLVADDQRLAFAKEAVTGWGFDDDWFPVEAMPIEALQSAMEKGFAEQVRKRRWTLRFRPQHFMDRPARRGARGDEPKRTTPAPEPS